MTRLIETWLTDGATQALFDLYEDNGWQLFAVGGCVRNALLGVAVSDIDMASDAPPEIAAAVLERAGYRVIPTGIAHGTLTVIVSNTPFEITTFRKDVSTDGRRATVAYSNNIKEDAKRRDFTINALYSDRHGQVIDPLGTGLNDIAQRVVRFIDAPQDRIAEDYLRILRFFRFHARFAQMPADEETLDAIARNIKGLHQLSAERITSELLKILALPDPAPTCGLMRITGVLPAILPGSQVDSLAPFVHVADVLTIAPNPIARLAALGGADILSQLRLSKAEARDFANLRDAMSSFHPDAALANKLGQDIGAQAVALRYAVFSNPPSDTACADIARGASAEFPVSASDLGPDYTGAKISARLKQLKTAWYASDLTLTRQDLLALPDDPA